jgi:1A family penicillin-binding protein
MKRLKLLSAILFAIFAITAGLIYRYLLVDLPRPDELYQYASAPSTNIYDRNGVLLYQITDPHQGSHTPLTLAEIPQSCVDATVATEDATFFSNAGFDTRAMVRALIDNFRERQIVSGASTITQQLARNLLFTQAERTEVSMTRKLREIILAWRLTNTYSKEEILTLYLNETYYGNLAYGLEAASTTFFGKHAAELDLAECALLAGLPQNPVFFNPLENLPAAQARQRDVLALMVRHNKITADRAALAEAEKLQFAAIPFPIKAPHFVMYIRGQLERLFGQEEIYTQGLQVYTTLDLDMQNHAQRVAQYRLEQLAEAKDGSPPRNVRNAAVVILDPNTGEILTMLGSPDYFDPRIDGAVNATVASRQPGSSIKPITYAAAFDPQLAARYGYPPLTAATMMMDVRTAFLTKEGDPYVPQNYDRLWHGPVLLRQSLASSFNLVAVKVLDYVGLEAMTDLARRMGITTFDQSDRFGLSLTLGGGEVHLLELTAAYAAFSNGGYRVEPTTILNVTTSDGRVLWQSKPGRLERVLSPQSAFLIPDILSDNFARASAFGEGSSLRLSRPAAAKTGTTSDFRDNWTIGYTPDFVTGVWAGNADNEPMRHVSGITGAAPIWHDIMEAIHKNRPVHRFSQPDSLTTVTVCAVNGLLPSDGCQRTLNELFIAGTEPRQRDNWYQLATIDRRNGLLAGIDCSPEQTLNRWFIRYPGEAQPWLEQYHITHLPTDYSPFCPADDTRLALADTDPTRSEADILTQRLVASPIYFTSPDQGTTYRVSPDIPLEKQKIRISVQLTAGIKPGSVQLFADGQPLAQGAEALWQLSPGTHRFEATATNAEGEPVQVEAVEIEVHE